MRKRAALVAAILLTVPACEGGIQLGNGQNNETTSSKSVLNTNHIQEEWGGKKFKPTGIVLHWWGNDGRRGINGLIRDLNSVETTFDASHNANQHHPVNGHTGVQVGVDLEGVAYQLTPTLDTFARHATCANSWAIGIEIAGSDGGKTGPYIGDNARQFKGVVAVVRELMDRYDIPAENILGKNARSGSGILSHHQVDAKCTWKDGVRFGSGKTDVGEEYLHRVLSEVGG